MVEIVGSVILKEVILPFLLVFVVSFAVLQKSQVLGVGKAQVDALVSLSIALILIVTPIAREFIVNFTPWVAVGMVVILVFLLLYGFVREEKWKADKWIPVTFGILGGLFVIALVIYFSGAWDSQWFSNLFSMTKSGTLWANILLIGVIVGAAVWVVKASGGSSSSKKPGE